MTHATLGSSAQPAAAAAACKRGIQSSLGRQGKVGQQHTQDDRSSGNELTEMQYKSSSSGWHDHYREASAAAAMAVAVA